MIWRTWGRSGSQPVVFLHGGSGSWRHWIKTVPVLSEHYEVWAPDLPGLGDSAMPAAPLTPETCGGVVAHGMRQIFSANQTPDVVAFSFGAHVGGFAVAELGDRVKSFTISGCAALGLTHNRVTFEKVSAEMTAEQGKQVHRRNLAALMIRDESRIDDLAVYIHATNIAKARFKSRSFAVTDELRRILPTIKVPLRTIWGGRDQIAIPDVESRINLLRTIHPTLIARVIPDAGHWVAYEQPGAFNAALAEFLAEAPTPRHN